MSIGEGSKERAEGWEQGGDFCGENDGGSMKGREEGVMKDLK